MRRLNNRKYFLALLCLLIVLPGCGSSAGSAKTESLEIDYVSEDGEIGEERVSSEGGNVIDRLTEKLSADKSDAGKQTEISGDIQSDEEESGIQAAYSKGNKAHAEDGAENDHKTGEDEEDQDDSGKDSGENEGESSEEEDDQETNGTATITIRCDTAVANGMHEDPRWTGIVPASGCILPVTTMKLEEEDTVFTLLCRVRDKYKLQMEYNGTGGNEYIEGINNLYEFDGGRWSGWMYCVNDWYPNYGCGQYLVSDGDVIEWNYTCDLGLDLEGAAWEGAEEWKNTHD